MFQWMRDRFYAKEIAALEILRDSLQKDVDGLFKDYNDRKFKLENKIESHKIVTDAWEVLKKEKLEDILREQIEQNAEYLKRIVDFKLLPGKKVWSMEGYSNDIKHIEITALVIKKDEVKIEIDGFYSTHYFHTKKEAEKTYNDMLESKKIK